MRRPLRALLLALLLAALLPAIASAQQPIEPLGTQQRVTHQGPDGDVDFSARAGDVVFNPVRNEYLAVWEGEDDENDMEIFAQRLRADGAPIEPAFPVTGLESDSTGFESQDPAVAYDPERDRYGVAFQRDDDVDGELEIFIQLVSGAGAIIGFDGAPSAVPVIASNIGGSTNTQIASRPDLVYRPDVDGAGSPDAWVVVYDGDDVDNQTNIFAVGVNAASGTLVSGNDRDVSAMGVDGDGREPSAAVIPGTEDIGVAWEGSLSTSGQGIFVRRMPGSLPDVGGQSGLTSTGPPSAESASLTAGAGQMLVAFAADDPANDDEIFVRRLNLDMAPLAAAQQVSSSGPQGTSGPPFFSVSSASAAYHPSLDRYLVTWIGQDVDRPGLSEDEREVMGSVLAPDGTELSPQDFTVSRVGVDVDDDFAPVDTTATANTASRRWLALWSADGTPAADNELELFDRQVGENFDVDADGFPVPADCNDGNAGIRPGAPDVPDNGVDEDCSGADGVNLDRDADGSLRPADCDDANAAIAPGKTDVPNNDVDEDCSGAARRVLTGASIERFFKVFRNSTQVTKLRVTKAKKAMKVRLRCTPSKGKGCPKKLRGDGRSFTLEQAGAKDLTKHIKKARLEPGAVLEVRILETGAIGRLDRFTMRKAKLPKRTQRCIPFGTKSPEKCG